MIPLIVTTIVIGVWINMAYRHNRKKSEKSFDNFLAQEMRANTSRKKEVEARYFFTADPSSLPFRDYSENEKHLSRRQAEVKNRLSKRMLRFEKKYSNTELKQRYGIANFDEIVQYEENYDYYLRSLLDWGQALTDSQYLDDAEAVLTESLRLGSQHSKGYLLLVENYRRQKDEKKLRRLADITKERYPSGDNFTKSNILKAIDRAIDEEGLK